VIVALNSRRFNALTRTTMVRAYGCEPRELVHRPLMCVRLAAVSTGTISQPELQTTAGKYGLKINLEQTANLAELYGPLGEAGGILQAQFVKRARCGHLLGSPACTQAWLTDATCVVSAGT